MKIIDAVKEKEMHMKYGELESLENPDSYYEFKNMKEVDEWGTKNYSDWAEAYKKIFRIIAQYKELPILHVQDPVDSYLGNEYKIINEYLRKKGPTDSDCDIRLRISNLIVAISSAPVIDQKIVLYRQVPYEMIKEMIELNKEKDSHPYQEKGFMSTSLLKTNCAQKCGNSKYMLKMYVENNCPIHAIYANAIRVRDEAELLLPPGLFMWMTRYPYVDVDTKKTVYEVKLFSMNSITK